MKETVRLDKVLANSGYGSRKDIKKLVRSGTVAVNGQPARDSSIHVSLVKDIITVNGVQIVYKEFIYLMLNKPAGYISATEDQRDPTVIDLVPEEFSHYDLFPVGRLDKDTVGLLLITNDGKLAHDLLSPKKHVPKKYFARVDGTVSENLVRLFSEGVTIDDGYKTKPAELTIVSAGDSSEVELIITEGKFHQVKRMFQAVNMKVTFLQRTEFGPLTLDEELTSGEVRELSERELSLLKSGS
ncbi:MAG TPA: pseudouridine synthase [Desulfobacteria bacterium]|nr:pseudouridine synthase [Desulfobacteria bacterium]